MQISKIFAALLTIGCYNAAWAQSVEGHSGHGGGSSGSGGNELSCIKARISRYNPEHLATVAPGSEFSFAVSGSNGPGHIHVSIRQEPVDVSIEDKETFYLVKGRLPDDIKNETVRISIKAKAKVGKCDADGGWLLKVTE
ncbi:MAG: hypothetical protein ACXV7J_02160 [Methylomonas sp.]